MNWLRKAQLNPQQLIQKYELFGNNDGREVGPHTREFTVPYSKELEEDLRTANIPFSITKADNPNHKDFGRPILIFTLFL